MLKACVICGKYFEAKSRGNKAVTCCEEHSRELRKKQKALSAVRCAERNPEKNKERQDKWKKNHPEGRQKIMKKYRLSHPAQSKKDNDKGRERLSTALAIARRLTPRVPSTKPSAIVSANRRAAPGGKEKSLAASMKWYTAQMATANGAARMRERNKLRNKKRRIIYNAIKQAGLTPEDLL